VRGFLDLNLPLQAEVAKDVATGSGHTPDWCLHTDVAAQVLVNRNHDGPNTRLYLFIFILALSFVPYRTYMMFLKVLWAIQYPCFVTLAILFNLFKEGGNFFMKNVYFFHFLKQ